MDPTNEELCKFKEIADVFTWLEMEPELVTGVFAVMGKATSLRAWGRIPPKRFEEAISTIKVKDGESERGINPMEEGQVGEILRVVRMALGPLPSGAAAGDQGAARVLPVRASQVHPGEGDLEGGAPAAEEPGPLGVAPGHGVLYPLPRETGEGEAGLGTVEIAGPATPRGDSHDLGATAKQNREGEETGVRASEGAGKAGSGRASAENAGNSTTTGLVPGELGCVKIKLASVLDQADDTEIKPLAISDLRAMMERWKETANDGEEPSEEEEATGEQISALAFRLRSGGTPFVDFGVWRPHGADLGRALRFAAYFLSPAGEFQRKELSGPSSFAEWARAWRVFAFAMEILNAATRTRLKRYYDTIAALNADYPGLWWLVALADHKMRRSQMERIRRRLAG